MLPHSIGFFNHHSFNLDHCPRTETTFRITSPSPVPSKVCLNHKPLGTRPQFSGLSLTDHPQPINAMLKSTCQHPLSHTPRPNVEASSQLEVRPSKTSPPTDLLKRLSRHPLFYSVFPSAISYPQPPFKQPLYSSVIARHSSAIPANRLPPTQAYASDITRCSRPKASLPTSIPF